MGLSNALIIGRSGLLAHQTAIEVAGNNLANLATPGYKKQRIDLSQASPQEIASGVFIGRGVQLDGITRQVNEALESRLRAAAGDSAASDVRYQLLTQVEAIQNELSDIDLSTRLGEFFNAFSQLATNPQDPALRTLAIQESGTMAEFLRSVHGEYVDLREQVDSRILDVGRNVDDLLTRLETINQTIVNQEQGSGGAGALRDNRDTLLGELASYLDISTVQQANGAMDVYVGSTPILQNGRSRGVEVVQLTEDGVPTVSLQLKSDGTPLDPGAGELGGLIEFRFNDSEAIFDTLNEFTHELIYAVNGLHSQGQSLTSVTSYTGASAVEDSTVALNDEDSGLNFRIQNGSFRIHLTNATTGLRTSETIDVDLDGIGAQTTLDDLATQIDAVAGVNASVGTDGRLVIASETDGSGISFSDDSSGALAALGINALFKGDNAFDIEVNFDLLETPGALAVGQDFLPGDNGVALAIAALRDDPIDDLDGLSLSQYWSRHVEDIAVKAAQARDANEAAGIVEDNLSKQQQAYAGVNADEEAIDLIKYQRAYQASARFISTIDEMFQTLLSIV